MIIKDSKELFWLSQSFVYKVTAALLNANQLSVSG